MLGDGRELLNLSAKAEGLDPQDFGIAGCLEYAVPKEGQCFPDKALLLPTLQHRWWFLTHPACVRAAGLGFRMNHLLSQPKQGHFVGMQNKPLKTQSIWSPLLNVLSEKAAIP